MVVRLLRLDIAPWAWAGCCCAGLFPPPAPKAEANGKWKDLELLTEGLVLVTEVVMVFWACVKDGPPPTPILALAGTVKFKN